MALMVEVARGWEERLLLDLIPPEFSVHFRRKTYVVLASKPQTCG